MRLDGEGLPVTLGERLVDAALGAGPSGDWYGYLAWNLALASVCQRAAFDAVVSAEVRAIVVTPYIRDMIAWLRRCGVTVHEYAFELPCGTSGMYRSETREVFLNEPNAHSALMTIAHEAGHWLGYLIDEKPHSYQRERQAFAYGWHVLRWFDAPVTRQEWLAWHAGAAQLYAAGIPATEHLYRNGS